MQMQTETLRMLLTSLNNCSVFIKTYCSVSLRFTPLVVSCSKNKKKTATQVLPREQSLLNVLHMLPHTVCTCVCMCVHVRDPLQSACCHVPKHEIITGVHALAVVVPDEQLSPYEVDAAFVGTPFISGILRAKYLNYQTHSSLFKDPTNWFFKKNYNKPSISCNRERERNGILC